MVITMDPGELLARRAKLMMRRRFRGLRASMPKAALQRRSERICATLLDLDLVRQARSVALFWPIDDRNEVDLARADAELRRLGVTIAFPAIASAGEASMCFRTCQPEELADRGNRFPEPPPEAPKLERDLDVVVVPGLTFDGAGYRIGYGAGQYDRTLPYYCPPARSIGVAFDFQLAVDLPHDGNDVPVHMIVTDRRVITVG